MVLAVGCTAHFHPRDHLCPHTAGCGCFLPACPTVSLEDALYPGLRCGISPRGQPDFPRSRLLSQAEHSHTFWAVFDVRFTYSKMHNSSLSFDKRVHLCNQHPNQGVFPLLLNPFWAGPDSSQTTADLFHRRSVSGSTVLGALVSSWASLSSSLPSPWQLPSPFFYPTSQALLSSRSDIVTLCLYR